MPVGFNRFELRMSQQDLTDALRYKARSIIAKIKSGENDVTQKKLQRFAEDLDTTVEALITGVSTQSSTADSHTPLSAISLPTLSIALNTETAEKNRTVAVILTGGKSSLNQQNIPNQFINIHGKPVIIYLLEAYQAHPTIDDICNVYLKGWEQIMTAYAEQYGNSKLRILIPSASSDILSVKNAPDPLKK